MEKGQRLILFLVFLTGLAHITFSASYRYEEQFTQFRFRLKQLIINDLSSDVLPFSLLSNFNEDLQFTSHEFKNFCIFYDAKHFNEHSYFAPVSSLREAITTTFYYYGKSANEYRNIVEQIQFIDPIGLNVYLTKKNVKNSSPTFIQFVMEFYATMNERIRLTNMKTNDSYIEIFEENRYGTIYEVPHAIREQIATEYGSISSITFKFFIEIAMENLANITMYPINVPGKVQYKEHYSKDVDDVQILFDYIPLGCQDVAGNSISGHTKCIHYKASVQKVYVYDSGLSGTLSQSERQIINILYPFNKGFSFKRPKTVQDCHYPTCVIFSIAYATMLLLGENPTEEEIRLNEVHGDETLYMRIHLLNTFVNRKLKI